MGRCSICATYDAADHCYSHKLIMSTPYSYYLRFCKNCVCTIYTTIKNKKYLIQCCINCIKRCSIYNSCNIKQFIFKHKFSIIIGSIQKFNINHIIFIL